MCSHLWHSWAVALGRNMPPSLLSSMLCVWYQRCSSYHAVRPLLRFRSVSTLYLLSFHIYGAAFNARLVENVLDLCLRTFFFILPSRAGTCDLNLSTFRMAFSTWFSSKYHSTIESEWNREKNHSKTHLHRQWVENSSRKCDSMNETSVFHSTTS